MINFRLKYIKYSLRIREKPYLCSSNNFKTDTNMGNDGKRLTRSNNKMIGGVLRGRYDRHVGVKRVALPKGVYLVVYGTDARKVVVN